MSDANDLICENFENEKWLFLEKELSEHRIIFWERHLQKCIACSLLVKSDIDLLEKLCDELSADVLDSRYEIMIDETVQNKSKLSLNWLFSFIDKITSRTKIALIGGLAVIAIMISLITPKQNSIKTISNELLDWEGEKINSQIENIENRIETITNDNWNNDVNTIDERLQKLEIDIEKF